MNWGITRVTWTLALCLPTAVYNCYKLDWINQNYLENYNEYPTSILCTLRPAVIELQGILRQLSALNNPKMTWNSTTLKVHRWSTSLRVPISLPFALGFDLYAIFYFPLCHNVKFLQAKLKTFLNIFVV